MELTQIKNIFYNISDDKTKTNNYKNKKCSQNLVLIDGLGKTTSFKEGLALAFSVLENILLISENSFLYYSTNDKNIFTLANLYKQIKIVKMNNGYQQNFKAVQTSTYIPES